jgi:hypothetical protein
MKTFGAKRIKWNATIKQIAQCKLLSVLYNLQGEKNDACAKENSPGNSELREIHEIKTQILHRVFPFAAMSQQPLKRGPKFDNNVVSFLVSVQDHLESCESVVIR